MIIELEDWSVRRWGLAGLAFCVLMMAVALGLEHAAGMEPCPLCIFQRVAVMAAGVVFALAAWHNPKGRGGAASYAVLGVVAVGSGIALAWRHLWLQSLPADQVPSCGPSLGYMVDVLPLREVLATVLTGSGECAEVGATLLGLSLPGWTLIGFLILMLVPFGLLARALRREHGYRWHGVPGRD